MTVCIIDKVLVFQSIVEGQLSAERKTNHRHYKDLKCQYSDTLEGHFEADLSTKQ